MKINGIKPKQYFTVGYIVLLIFFAACANIVAPTGGKKDTTPPKVLKAEPPNFSTHFKGNTIRLYFDEYVQLKDESRVMLVSPPPEKLPEARIKGKSIILTLAGTLKESTTYSIQFGSAIQDFNEGNPMTNFTYVFSTGNVIDSLSVAGTVLKADNLVAASKVMVCLYSNTDDSVIFKEKPRYIARTDENGNFLIEHIANGVYKMIALKDDNTDLLASIPAEEIAFPDSLIHPVYKALLRDTSRKDSSTTIRTATPGLTLYLFKQKDSTLRFQKAYLEKPFQLVLPFSVPVEKVELKAIGSSADINEQWYLPEWSKNHDTLTYWIRPSLTKDSLNLSLSAGKKVRDTIKLDLRRFGKGGKYRRDKDKTGKLNAISNISPNFSPEDDIILTFSYPVIEAELNELKLIRPKDTVDVKPVFTDSLKRRLLIHYKWEENSSYQFVIPKGALKDWTGQTNDSLVFKFATKPLQDYGNLVFNFTGSKPGQYILQLLDPKEKVVKETTMNTSGSWKLNYLNPGQYKIKVIRDKNSNSHWDSGNYRFKIQPEQVTYYPKTLEIRGNWDLEEIWKW